MLPKKNFLQWKASALKAIRSCPHFSPYVIESHTELALSPSFPSEERKELRQALSEALDQRAQARTGINDPTSFDGYNEWCSVCTILRKTIHTTTARKELKKSLESIRNGTKEHYNNFQERFDRQYIICLLNGIDPFEDRHDRHMSYLRCLNHPAFSQVLLQMDTNSPSAQDWLDIQDIQQLQFKAVEYIGSYNVFHPTQAPPKKKEEFRDKTPLQKRCNAFENAIKGKSASQVVSILKDFASKHQGCYLHQLDNHPFHRCNLVPKILRRQECLPCLETAFPPAPPLVQRNPRANHLRGYDTLEAERNQLRQQHAQVTQLIDAI